MVLSVHTLVGGALGAVLPVAPATSFVIGFISHFVLDAIPHSDYPLRSLSKDREDRGGDAMVKDARLAHDIFVNGIDGILGFLVLISLTVNSGSLVPIVFGAIGACVPDGLQFLHFMFPKVRWLKAFKSFHGFFHTPIKVEEFMKKHIPLSIFAQGVLACIALVSIIKTVPIPF